jgi:hypothetical protein
MIYEFKIPDFLKDYNMKLLGMMFLSLSVSSTIGPESSRLPAYRRAGETLKCGSLEAGQWRVVAEGTLIRVFTPLLSAQMSRSKFSPKRQPRPWI